MEKKIYPVDENQQTSQLLDVRARSEISLSIESLKHNLINNLEKILRRTSKDLRSSVHGRNVDEVDNADDDDIKGDISSQGSSLRKDEGSIRELASSYLKERESVLKTMMATTGKVDTVESKDDGGVNRQASQWQMRIWTDVATDLDGYYLELLNKFLRVGRLSVDDLKQRTLLTYRLSDSAVHDLHKNKTKQIFQSQADVHDDVIFGQLQDTFNSSAATVDDFIEGLLARTNARRQYAVCYFDNEAVSEKDDKSSKCGDFDGSDEDWDESLGAGSSITQEGKESNPKANDHIPADRKPSFEDVIKTYEEYIGEQNDELKDRKEIIDKLKEENDEMIKAFDSFEQYEALKGKESEVKIQELTDEYETKLEEKKSEILELQKKLSEYEDSQVGNITKKEDESRSKCNNGYQSLKECFEKTCQQLKLLAEAADDCKSSFDLKSYCEDVKLLGHIPNSSEVHATFSLWVADRLVKLCERYKCCEINKENNETCDMKPSVKEYVDDLFMRLFKAADHNDKVLRNIKAKAEVDKADLQRAKSQYTKVRCKLQSLVVKNQDLLAQIVEKDDEISMQAELLNQQKLELSDLRSQNELLSTKITTLLEDLSSEQERSVLLDEELRNSMIIEREKTDENERLVEFFVENANDMTSSKEVSNEFPKEELGLCIRCEAKKVLLF